VIVLVFRHQSDEKRKITFLNRGEGLRELISVSFSTFKFDCKLCFVHEIE